MPYQESLHKPRIGTLSSDERDPLPNRMAGIGGRTRALVALFGGLALAVLSIRPALSVLPGWPVPGEAHQDVRTETLAHGSGDRLGYYALAPSEEITRYVHLPVVLNGAAPVGILQTPTPTGTPTSTPTATPSATATLPPGALPDLTIAGGWVSMRGYSGGCVVEYGPLVTTVCVDNWGLAPAGQFKVRAGSYGGGPIEWQVESLAAGDGRCLEREQTGWGEVKADADDEVVESDESNNSGFLAVPTAPLLCTAMPTPTATSEPAETVTPTPTGTPGAALRIADIQPAGSDEVITIANQGTSPQELTGWSIQSYGGASCQPVADQVYSFPVGYTLAAGQSVRVHSGPDAVNNPPADLFWTTENFWNNNGDRGDLRAPGGSVVDSYGYGQCQ